VIVTGSPATVTDLCVRTPASRTTGSVSHWHRQAVASEDLPILHTQPINCHCHDARAHLQVRVPSPRGSPLRHAACSASIFAAPTGPQFRSIQSSSRLTLTFNLNAQQRATSSLRRGNLIGPGLMLQGFQSTGRETGWRYGHCMRSLKQQVALISPVSCWVARWRR